MTRPAARAALRLTVALALTAAAARPAPAAGPQDADSPRPDSLRSDARLDSLTAAVADRLRCPVCRNQSVLESTATLARRMQRVIRQKLAAGESPRQVEAYFVDKYGPWIRLKPEPEGIGLLVYLLPALALAAGAGGLAWAVRRWTARPDPEAAAPAPPDRPDGR